jgi:LPXTG-motif cell wall-anchored protein
MVMGTSRIRSATWRAAAAAALVLVGVAATIAPAGADEPVAAAESAITITQTPSGAGGVCTPAPLGLTYTTANDAETFTLRIVAASPPCTPIEAKAVVYAMPGNGELWPQTLSEVVPFTISEAGVTEVVFAKGCGPVQFDVLTGETPTVISPLGAWHGPLLFPFDTATSLQYFGDPSCNPTTTTTASTTTTSTPEVNGSTTVPVSSTTPPPEVESVTTLPASVAGTTQEPAQLALTGSGTRWGALVGASMIAAGAAMLLMSRRRSQAPADA